MTHCDRNALPLSPVFWRDCVEGPSFVVAVAKTVVSPIKSVYADMPVNIRNFFFPNLFEICPNNVGGY